NITSIADTSRDGTDNQCFTYDHLGRLTDAWAQGTNGCSSTAGSLLGGPAPYWQSYSYDATGNRRTETQHDPAGNASQDVTRTYDYPAPKAPRPHGLTQVTTAGPTGSAIDSYSYDTVGNTHTRTIGGDTQTLDWDAEGHLAKVTEGSKTTSYVYDADGNRLIRRTDNETTLYLGGTELTLAKGASTAKATRYYDLGGGNQAIRTDDGTLSFLLGDHHGTSELAVAATDLTMQQRRATPFGGPRGKAPTSWPGQKGFVGGTDDPTTGLTHLGAREYDQATGRFLSLDPVMDTGDPQQMNGYAYSRNNPVTNSDPAGLRDCGETEYCGKGSKPNIKYGTAASPAPAKSSGDKPSVKGSLTIQSEAPTSLSSKGQKAWNDALDEVRAHRNFFANGAETPEGLAAMSELFWGKYCGSVEKGECPAARTSATSLKDFGLRQYDTGLGSRLEPMAAASSVAGMTTAQALKNLMDPEHLRGQSEEYVIELADKAGFSNKPMKPTSATGGRGTQIYKPDDSNVMLFMEAGDPESTSADKVHQGPYVKYQISGAGKDGAFRVPIAGNPHPELGGDVPTVSRRRIMQFLLGQEE
ncbi:RHS repeat domain-containing protein, partial [Streptomyces sp. NPDC002574]|uniref:RHS repeat domain-containing protein n=1 Tax=Streptomyces sp. NPDC002574 TaxID=3364652 RepID=UPI0036AFE84B